MGFVTTLKDKPKVYIVVLSIITVVVGVNESKQFIQLIITASPIAILILAAIFLSFVHYGVRERIWR